MLSPLLERIPGEDSDSQLPQEGCVLWIRWEVIFNRQNRPGVPAEQSPP